MAVRCIEQIATKHMTFRPGETYVGSEVNEHFWIVDSVGISTEDFHLHFEVIEEEKEPIVIAEEEAEEPIEEKVDEVIVETCKGIADRYPIQFLEIGTDKDHVHMLVQSIPRMSPTEIIRIIYSLTKWLAVSLMSPRRPQAANAAFP